VKAFRLLNGVALFAALAGSSLAQQAQVSQPMYAHPKPIYDNSHFAQASTALQTWNGTFQYQGNTDHFTMVGTDPSATNVTTTYTVYVIPVKIGIKNSSGQITYFDPLTKLSNGQTAVQNMIASPIFQNQDYTIGGTDLGNTQFEDAYQRGNFWTDVMTNTNYHLLLKPTVLPEVTVVVPTNKGKTGNQFGVNVAEVDYNWFDAQVQAGLPKLKQVGPNTLPLIMAYNTYWTELGGLICCIGGWHNAYGNANTPQTYSIYGYTNSSTAFASDVSALSHELGEWIDDPYVNNVQGACGGILEVGDPIENETNPKYGDYTYTLGGFTYHIQDLVNLQYFGQTPSTSNNGNWTFQGQNGNLPGLGQIGVCSFGQ